MADVALISTSHPVEIAANLIAERLFDGARLGIPGGSAVKVVEAIRRIVAPELWRTLRLTWVDERAVPFADPASNRGEAHRSGALSTEHPTRLELPLFEDAESASQAAQRCDAALARDFGGGLDVALLGLGEDGHIASLFPGHPALHAPGLVVAVDGAPKPPPGRVTLTLTVLRDPRVFRVLFATGAGKRRAIERLLAGDDTVPAALLGPLTLVTDPHFEDKTKGIA